MSKQLADLIPLVLNCGGPGSGVPGPCPMGGKKSGKQLSTGKSLELAKKAYEVAKSKFEKHVSKAGSVRRDDKSLDAHNKKSNELRAKMYEAQTKMELAQRADFVAKKRSENPNWKPSPFGFYGR